MSGKTHTLVLSDDELQDIVDGLRWTHVALFNWTPLPSPLNALWDVLEDKAQPLTSMLVPTSPDAACDDQVWLEIPSPCECGHSCGVGEDA